MRNGVEKKVFKWRVLFGGDRSHCRGQVSFIDFGREWEITGNFAWEILGHSFACVRPLFELKLSLSQEVYLTQASKYTILFEELAKSLAIWYQLKPFRRNFLWKQIKLRDYLRRLNDSARFIAWLAFLMEWILWYSFFARRMLKYRRVKHQFPR